MTISSVQEQFIEAMVEAQEFIEVLEVYDEVDSFNTFVSHPFTQAQETKLNDLFESTVAEHTEITEDMIVIVLSDYAQGINKRLALCS